MLERLDTIPWEKLTHAYGAATDVPRLLRDLAAEDAEVRERAYYELYGNLWHQGTVYEATAYAVPFLIELLEQPSVQDKDTLLIYLADLANGNSYLHVHQHLDFYDQKRNLPEFEAQLQQELAWVQAARDAVRSGCPVYDGLLQHEIPQVRAAAAYLLGMFKENAGENLDRLRSHIASGEQDEMVRTACVFAVGMLAAEEPAAVDWLKEVLDGADSFSIRIAAALWLALSVPKDIPERVRDILIAALSSPGSAKTVFEQLPWPDADLQTYCSGALMRFGGSSSQLLPALLKALEDVTPLESCNVVQSILFQVLDGKPMPDTMRLHQLSEDQRTALQTIASSKKFWTGGLEEDALFINAAQLMQSFGLPQRPGRLQAFLDGKLTPKDPEWSSL